MWNLSKVRFVLVFFVCLFVCLFFSILVLFMLFVVVLLCALLNISVSLHLQCLLRCPSLRSLTWFRCRFFVVTLSFVVVFSVVSIVILLPCFRRPSIVLYRFLSFSIAFLSFGRRFSIVFLSSFFHASLFLSFIPFHPFHDFLIDTLFNRLSRIAET